MADRSDLIVAGAIGTSKESAPVRSLARGAYLTLRDGIIRGRLRPLQQLKVVELVAELGVNSSAVREALSRLAAEHLVEAREQRGFRVAALSVEELDDITRTRIDIETMMLARSMARGANDPGWRRRIEAARDAILLYYGDRASPEGASVHNEFHAALLAACDSPSLDRIRSELFVLSQRYRSLALHAAPDWQVDEEHAELADAVLKGEVARAQAALSRHIGGTAAIVRETVARQLRSSGG